MGDFAGTGVALDATGLWVAGMRLAVAMACGGAIGFERQWHARPAGLRTHIMVALAGALFTLVAFELIALPSQEEERLRFDPLRLIEAVTSGVAFLAAGSIIVSGGQVHGITTGAGMWLAGAIGLACGAGYFQLALMATLLALVVLWLLRLIEGAMPKGGEDDD